MNYFASNLKYIRKRFEVSQTELASLVKKAQTTITYWENGATEPGLEQLVTLSKYFGITLDAFVLTDLSVSSLITEKHIQEFNPKRKTHTKTVGKMPALASEFKDDMPGKDNTEAASWAIMGQLKSLHEKVDKLEKAIRKRS